MSEVSFSLLDDASAAAGSGLVAGRGEERVETMISTDAAAGAGGEDAAAGAGGEALAGEGFLGQVQESL